MMFYLTLFAISGRLRPSPTTRNRKWQFAPLIAVTLSLLVLLSGQHVSSLEPSWTSSLCVKQRSSSLIVSLSSIQFRGGASSTTALVRHPTRPTIAPTKPPTPRSTVPTKPTVPAQTLVVTGKLQKNLVIASVVVASVGLLLLLRKLLGPYLSPQRLQERTILLLRNLQPEDPSDTWKALALYAFGMAVWELLGLSTIPVETAAGMVFGWSAFPASALGKLGGAVAAYGLGRTILSSWAKKQLANNTVFQLLEQSGNQGSVVAGARLSGPLAAARSLLNKGAQLTTTATPDKLDFMRTSMATAFLMKYSCFPEFVKNFGSSLLRSVTLDKFILVTIVHGWSYTALWTLLGVDSAARLEAAQLSLDMPPRNAALVSSLGLSFAIGFVVSPLLMAWWIRDLKVRSGISQQPTVRRKFVNTNVLGG